LKQKNKKVTNSFQQKNKTILTKTKPTKNKKKIKEILYSMDLLVFDTKKNGAKSDT